MTHRLRVAGPAMVVSVANGAVWKPRPSAAGTGVQSQSGSADQALPPAGQAGGRPGTRIQLESGPGLGRRVPGAEGPPGPRNIEVTAPAGGQLVEVGRVGGIDLAWPRRPGAVVEQHVHEGGLGGELGPGHARRRARG